MERLKPSEVRLLIVFSAVVLGLGSFFLYEMVVADYKKLKQEDVMLQTQKESFTNMMGLRTEFGQKRDYLDSNQPVLVSELKAEEALDTFVSVPKIQSHGLERLESRSNVPETRDNQRVFSRTVIVSGGLQGIVEWLTSLQSEQSFRAVTQFQIRPLKKTEPEILRCEIVLEQRYALDPAISPLDGVPSEQFEPTSSVPSMTPPGLPGEEASAIQDEMPGLVYQSTLPSFQSHES